MNIKNAAKEFLNRGVKNIIITLGEKGIFFANKDEKYFVVMLKLKCMKIHKFDRFLRD